MFRKTRLIAILFVLLLLIFSCRTTAYLHDETSNERQMELKKHRSGNIFGDIGLTLTSIIVLAAADVDPGLYPDGRDFKKIKLQNPTNDTIYVNMLTDVFWDEENYCDFMDIRIPPHKICKMLVPVDANYNIYFSNTPESEDDVEFIEVNTDDVRRLSLYPGLTKIDLSSKVESD